MPAAVKHEIKLGQLGGTKGFGESGSTSIGDARGGDRECSEVGVDKSVAKGAQTSVPNMISR